MKLSKEKLNTIKSDVQDLCWGREDRLDILSSVSSILCEINPDIAIQVMEHIGDDEALHQAMSVKVNYGY